MNEDNKNKCQLCGCVTNLTRHHLIPASKCHNKYKQIKNEESNWIWICRQCHDFLHSEYDNNELRDNLNTLEKLLADEKIMKFIHWRQKHPNDTSHSKMSNRRKN